MTVGLTPILTHPERNPTVIRDPDAFVALLSDGMYLQITASSLTGEFGEEARACASYLLKRGVVDLMATDAHSVRGRPPLFEKAVEAARKIVGEDVAERLVSENPARVLTGEPLG
jgi:protein-tyrosine phosphatase